MSRAFDSGQWISVSGFYDLISGGMASSTAAIWVYLSGTGTSSNSGDWKTMMKNWSTDVKGVIHLGLEASGLRVSTYINTSAGQVGPALWAGPLPVNVWTHIASVADGSGLRLFVSGNQVASTAFSGTITRSSGASGVLNYLSFGDKLNDSGAGADVGQPGYWFGFFAEAGFWKTWLTNDEISALNQAVLPSEIENSSLIGHWPLWGNVNPEIDASINNVVGTPSGATAGIDFSGSSSRVDWGWRPSGPRRVAPWKA